MERCRDWIIAVQLGCLVVLLTANKESQSTDPDQCPCLILSSSTTRLLEVPCSLYSKFPYTNTLFDVTLFQVSRIRLCQFVAQAEAHMPILWPFPQ